MRNRDNFSNGDYKHLFKESYNMGGEKKLEAVFRSFGAFTRERYKLGVGKRVAGYKRGEESCSMFPVQLEICLHLSPSVSVDQL